MNERNIELLTAFIDGEATRREHIAALRLLNQSSEARKMLWQLQQNAQALKQLPPRTLPADFAAKIVDAIKKTAAVPTPLQPAAAAPVRVGARFGTRLAWAAGLLLAVVGAAWYFLPRSEEPQIVENKKEPPKDAAKNKGPTPPAEAAPKPVDMAFADLSRPDRQELLAGELGKGQAFRLDLYVKKNRQAQALDRLGRELRFEAPAEKKEKDEDHCIFAENLMPADVAGFLAKLAREDKGDFERLRAAPMTATDRELVYTRLSITKDQLERPEERIPFIEAKTRKETAPPKNQPKAPERPAVVLTKEDSKQMRSFVDRRLERKPNSLQVLFVMHASGQSTTRLSDPVKSTKPAGEVLRTCGVTPQVRSTSPAGFKPAPAPS